MSKIAKSELAEIAERIRMRIRRSAEDIIAGDTVPRSWDQTHAGRLLIGYRRDERWSVALSGSVHTGWPTTPVLAAIVMCDRSHQEGCEKNMPPAMRIPSGFWHASIRMTSAPRKPSI